MTKITASAAKKAKNGEEDAEAAEEAEAAAAAAEDSAGDVDDDTENLKFNTTLKNKRRCRKEKGRRRIPTASGTDPGTAHSLHRNTRNTSGWLLTMVA